MTIATAVMTDKQRRAVEAMEAAREQGCSLTEYARAQGLVVREIYDALAALRRRGVLPKSGRKRRSKFVAVRVAQPVTTAVSTARLSGAANVLCRIVHAQGYVIECTQWPAPNWIAALSSRPTDAAA